MNERKLIDSSMFKTETNPEKCSHVVVDGQTGKCRRCDKYISERHFIRLA